MPHNFAARDRHHREQIQVANVSRLFRRCYHLSKDRESHSEYVDEILTCLEREEVTSKGKKCRFFTSDVKYLRHIIRSGRLVEEGTYTKSLKEAHQFFLAHLVKKLSGTL